MAHFSIPSTTVHESYSSSPYDKSDTDRRRGNEVGYSGGSRNNNNFALIVVLFILLIIVGSAYVY